MDVDFSVIDKCLKNNHILEINMNRQYKHKL